MLNVFCSEVFKARCKANPNLVVALKRVRLEQEKEGFPITAIREIKILKQLQHKNIVSLLEIVTSERAWLSVGDKHVFRLSFVYHFVVVIVWNL